MTTTINVDEEERQRANRLQCCTCNVTTCGWKDSDVVFQYFFFFSFLFSILSFLLFCSFRLRWSRSFRMCVSGISCSRIAAIYTFSFVNLSQLCMHIRCTTIFVQNFEFTMADPSRFLNGIQRFRMPQLTESSEISRFSVVNFRMASCLSPIIIAVVVIMFRIGNGDGATPKATNKNKWSTLFMFIVAAHCRRRSYVHKKQTKRQFHLPVKIVALAQATHKLMNHADKRRWLPRDGRPTYVQHSHLDYWRVANVCAVWGRAKRERPQLIDSFVIIIIIINHWWFADLEEVGLSAASICRVCVRQSLSLFLFSFYSMSRFFACFRFVVHAHAAADGHRKR